MQINKKNIELYQIRNPLGDGYGWADISIHCEGKKGRISIASDYGNWQTYWGAAGPDFKTFLGNINMDYAASNFGADGVFDLDGSIEEMKSDVIRNRRDLSLDEKKARYIFDEIKNIEENCHDKEEYLDWLRYSPHVMEFFDHRPPSRRKIHPLFVRFWKEAWPHFLAHLESEKVAA